MTKLFLFMNVSLDGYIEDAAHTTAAFHAPDDKFEAFQRRQSGETGTIVLGRKTYDVMKSFWPTPMAQQLLPDVAKYMNESPKFVVSHTPFAPTWENTTVISADVTEQIRTLKAATKGDIIILGSNNLAVTLTQAGLIDEFQIVVNPVVLGVGTPLLLGLPATIRLVYQATHAFDSGKILLTYIPER